MRICVRLDGVLRIDYRYIALMLYAREKLLLKHGRFRRERQPYQRVAGYINPSSGTSFDHFTDLLKKVFLALNISRSYIYLPHIGGTRQSDQHRGDEFTASVSGTVPGLI